MIVTSLHLCVEWGLVCGVAPMLSERLATEGNIINLCTPGNSSPDCTSTNVQDLCSSSRRCSRWPIAHSPIAVHRGHFCAEMVKNQVVSGRLGVWRMVRAGSDGDTDQIPREKSCGIDESIGPVMQD